LRLGRRQVAEPFGEADDRQPRPRDVVLPQLSHRVVEGGLARGQVVRLGRVRRDGVMLGRTRVVVLGIRRGERQRREGQRPGADQRDRERPAAGVPAITEIHDVLPF
jgi:hypothetical protein